MSPRGNMASPTSVRWKIRFAFLPGIAVWLVLAVSGTAAADRPAVSGDYRIPHARFSADMEVALRNGSWKEIAGVCGKIRDRGGFPEWMLEYGRLLLDSCPDRAILLTGTLADTDSALYWQSIAGYRRDVAVMPMGFLDRVWFLESVGKQYGICLAPDVQTNRRNPVPTVSPDISYSKNVLACFSRILRNNVNSRPICLSMDLSPDLLREMIPNLGMRGFVFLYPRYPETQSEADAITARLLLNEDAFKGLASENPVRSGPDSLRSHYRFVAKTLLATSGNSLKPADRDRLISLITGPFSPYAVDAGAFIPGSGTGKSGQEP